MTQKAHSRTSNATISAPVAKNRLGARNSGTTKKAQLIQMLSRKAGADIGTISDKFGWLPHTTRAALTGLRKSGYELTSEKAGDGKLSRYRIVSTPDGEVA